LITFLRLLQKGLGIRSVAKKNDLGTHAVRPHQTRLYRIHSPSGLSTATRQSHDCLLANAIPRALDVGQLGVCLTHAQSQRKAVVQSRVRQIQIAALVQAIQQRLVHRIASAVAETDQVQRSGRGQLELIVVTNPGRELLGQLDMAPYVVAQTLNSIVANDKPKLQRTEAAPQRDVPVSIVNNGARFGGLVAQVFGENTQRFNQSLPIRHVEAVAIEM